MSPGEFELTRRVEFSAAHRLHNPAFSEEKNREVFGVCNNPNGHGHNYGTEVLDGWVAVTQPEGWTSTDTERVRFALEALAGTQGPEK